MGTRILMVVGDALKRQYQPLGGLLRSEGYLLEEVSDEQSALGALQQFSPDLVLLDGDLENEGTLKTFQSLKKTQSLETVPFIYLANQLQKPDTMLSNFLDLGADDIITGFSDSRQVMARLKLIARLRQSLKRSEALSSQLCEMNAELYDRNTHVEKELHNARQLQQSLLPRVLDDRELINSSPTVFQLAMLSEFTKYHHVDDWIRICGVYLPCDALGGDIYDIIPFQDGSLGVTIADVSGHGVPAGFVTAMFKATFFRVTHTYSAPNDVLFHLNNELARIVKGGDYVTGVYCQFLKENRQVFYSGAGHPYPIVYHKATGEISRFGANGTPLVWIENMEYPLGTENLEPGDKILMFTDGITEMRNPSGELFGEPRLEEVFKKLNDEKAEAILDKLVEMLAEFSEGCALEDDVSLLLVEMM